MNQTSGYSSLPDSFFEHPVPLWAMAFVLQGRLIDNRVTHPADGDALLATRLKTDDPAAWMALALFTDLHRDKALPPDTSRLEAIFKAAGIPQDNAIQSMPAVAPALKAVVRSGPPLDPVTAEAAAATFRAEPEFQPLLSLCAATCPQTQDQCTAAFVAAFGHPTGRTTSSPSRPRP